MYLSRVSKLAVLSLLFAGYTATSQTRSVSNPTNGRENNPYSQYGIGELANGNNATLRGMGNATSAYSSGLYLNNDNPASYADLQRTTFEVGGTGSTRSIKSGDYSYRSGTASVSYLTLAVPVSKLGGLCFGFRPYSQAYYLLVDTISGTTNPSSPLDSTLLSYNGEGSLNYAYIGAATKWKGFSAGFNFGYLFGTFRVANAAVPIDEDPINKAYIAEYLTFNRVGGIYWKGGLQYATKLDSNYTIRFGATAAINQNINQRFSVYHSSIYSFGDTVIRDTLVNATNQPGDLTLPLTYSAGVMLSRNDKWNLALDYSATQWSNLKSSPDTSLVRGVQNNTYRISLGVDYTPDANSVRNYFSKVTYRMGAYYGTNYLKIGNTQLPYYGLTGGVSLPFKRALSRLNAAIDVGRLGTLENNLIQQTYVRFTVGMTFNDKWFIPRKYD